jgi:hypothetical protein
MASKQNQAMFIAIIAGILLLISGISGAVTWETIKDFLTSQFPGNQVLEIVFVIIIFIASLGGITVIIGGLLIGKNNVKTGKFLITLGAGMGLIGLLISIIIAFTQNSFTIGSFFSLGTIGLILSIIARMLAK